MLMEFPSAPPLLAPLPSDDDLTFYILNGLGSDFRKIATPLLTFEELHDILEGHDSYLRRLESSTQQLEASANYSYHHKQNFISYGGSHPKGSNKTNGSSRSPGHNKIPQGPFKDNHKSSTNRYTQMRYQPKCQFRDQIEFLLF